jgi:hypothetical protein
MGETKITESQVVQVILQLLIFIIPFTAIELTQAQMQAAAGLGGVIAIFAIRRRHKMKKAAQ